jgi:uncharacterized tellurite resistance protein B-like protein
MPALDALDPDARGAVLAIAACMAGADGWVSEEEKGALRGLAVALGEGAAPEATDVALDALDLDHLGPKDRMLAYAAAAWMMLADGIRARSESELLARVGRRLGIARSTAHFLAAHAHWVRADTDLPWHREADLLLTEAARRILMIEARRAA